MVQEFCILYNKKGVVECWFCLCSSKKLCFVLIERISLILSQDTELFNGSDVNIQNHHHISTTQQASLSSAVSANTSNIQSKSYAANSINEKLYTSTSATAYKLFASTPSLFPVSCGGIGRRDDWVFARKPKDTVVADLGCGEGNIAENHLIWAVVIGLLSAISIRYVTARKIHERRTGEDLGHYK